MTCIWSFMKAVPKYLGLNSRQLISPSSILQDDAVPESLLASFQAGHTPAGLYPCHGSCSLTVFVKERELVHVLSGPDFFCALPPFICHSPHYSLSCNHDVQGQEGTSVGH